MNNWNKYFESFKNDSKTENSSLDYLSEAIFVNIFGDPITNDNNWEKIKLGDSIEFKTGKSLSKSERDPYGDFKVYGGHGVLGKHSDYLFLDEKIIIGRVGAYCGNVLISDPYSWITKNAIVVDIKEGLFDKLYLAKLLQMLDLNRLANGIAQKYISIQVIKNQEAVLPPMKMQKKFSELQKLINSIEVKIDKRTELISNISGIIDLKV